MIPQVGDWYREKTSGGLFEVVSYDEDDGTVEVQYLDGTVDEMDIEDWDADLADGEISKTDPPEGW